MKDGELWRWNLEEKVFGAFKREREREREGVQYCSAEESRAELKRDNVSH
jgi:hypothetical protein